MVRVFHEMLV